MDRETGALCAGNANVIQVGDHIADLFQNISSQISS